MTSCPQNVLIVGGGLSGLAAAWQLHRHGVSFQLFEARDRLGGRVLSRTVEGARFDFGPSWVWNGQPYLAGLLKHFGIPVDAQFCDGDLLHQFPDGRVERNAVLKPMQDAFRIRGGTASLFETLAAELPKESVVLNARVRRLSVSSGTVRVEIETSGDALTVEAERVALAMPPRLAAKLQFEPVLDQGTLKSLNATPTWMAGHAKFFAFYEAPFWRDRQMSGDVFSRRGPLAEIHDASPPSGGPYALMAFVGVDGLTRHRMTRDGLMEAATNQLVQLFGSDASQATHKELMDWAEEPFTSTDADRRSPDHHPEYGLQLDLEPPWNQRLELISSETASENGGLIEGALARGCEFAREVIHQQKSKPSTLSETIPDPESVPDPHNASMSWDWI